MIIKLPWGNEGGSSQRSRPCQVAALLWGLALLLSPSSAQPAGTGVIRGQVSNQFTGSNPGQAQVTVLPANRDYYTERDGTFEIAGLAPGAYTLRIEYPGLDTKNVPVVVVAGRTSRLSVALNSDIYVMPQLVVAGQREGSAAAIVEQRVAPNVKNVITADTFGDITKANLGNILRRIPRVTGITDDEIDTSVIMVRGLEFNYTQQLSFLPRALRGLGVFLNYTWLQSTGERQTGGSTPLQNFVPRSGSTGLSYTYGRWDARLQLGYNSAFLDNLDSSSRWRDQYKEERYQLDFNGRCKLTRQLAVFVNLSNLTSQNYGEFRGNTSPVRREGTTGYSCIATAGIDATF